MGRKRKYPKHKQKTALWWQKEDEWGNFVFDWTLGLGPDTWREIFAVFLMIFAVISFIGIFGAAGKMGEQLKILDYKLFGTIIGYLVPIALFWLGVIIIFPPKGGVKLARFVGIALFFIFFPALIHLFIPAASAKVAALNGEGGGLFGYMISKPLRGSVGTFPAFVVLIAVALVSIMITFNLSLSKLFGVKTDRRSEDGEAPVPSGVKVHRQGQEEELEPVKRGGFMDRIRGGINSLSRRPKIEEVPRAPVIESAPRPSVKTNAGRVWQFPSYDILLESNDVAKSGDIGKNVETIKKCFQSFGIDVKMQDVNVGPTVTQYTLRPNEGVKLNQITTRGNDIALALAAKSLRVEAPIPGKSAVGIEVPNLVAAKVTLKEVMASPQFKAEKSKLAIALGRDVAGAPVAIDLEKMPHMMIAGSTGSGKSICINSIITNFLFHNSPEDLKLILIDPKRVELTNYNGIPNLYAPVVTEVDKTVSALKWTVYEMERRYKMFAELGKRNIVAYNESPGSDGKLPYIVVIIDELADLMAVSANEVEASIVRIAQMARATGIHLIIATQRPSVDVLTGLIKANITSRIAFAAASQVDSRTILDMSGAEKLLGNGDMLFIGNGLSKPRRIQGCFVSDKEINQLVDFLKKQGEPEYDESILSFRPAKAIGGRGSGGSIDDDLYEEAVQVVTNSGQASASLLQRRLRVGYARAARLLDIMEQEGVIGPSNGAKPRDILISTDQSAGGNDQFPQDY
ncbi:MAG: DNA translocase FtsK [Candidatus Berkelbacteria bacterium]